MNIAVIAHKASNNEIISFSPDVNWIHTVLSELNQHEFSAVLNLNENAFEEDYSGIGHPVFINSVAHTLIEKNMPQHVVRINGWNGFLERDTWEIAGTISDDHEKILKVLNKKYIAVADEPGLVSARILAMIINEAYFARQDKVSTEKSIDIAMKLGTNYPFGPFEWKDKIGANNILTLLNKLQQSDTRYCPSTLLIEEANRS